MRSRTSARNVFRLGVLLILAGVICELFLTTTLGLLWGYQALNEAVNLVSFQYLVLVPLNVLEPLGVAFVVLSVVARHIEADGVERGTTTDDEDDVRLPPALTARSALAVGVVLSVLGLVLRVGLNSWIVDLETGIARDILSLVVVPLRDEIFLAGVLLVASAEVIQMITVNR